MREIKFRAWDKENKKMYHVMSLTRPEQTYLTLVRENMDGVSVAQETEILEFMQYTGLKDKKGVEIYEGDIVKVGYFYEDEETSWENETIHVVEWFGDYPAFDLNPCLDCECNALQLYASIREEHQALEIIGNIHEHAYLLTSPT